MKSPNITPLSELDYSMLNTNLKSVTSLLHVAREQPPP